MSEASERTQLAHLEEEWMSAMQARDMDRLEELVAPGFRFTAIHLYPEPMSREQFDLLQAERAGISLTENGAMTPAASVSGLYFAHPLARYFTVGRIGRDQVESYAARKGLGVEETERWLRPNLGYD